MTDRPDPLTDPITATEENTAMSPTASIAASITRENKRPEVVETASPIPAALDHARDRLARTDAILANLREAIGTLIHELAPVLTDGTPATYPVDPVGTDVKDPGGDRRSTIARSIADLASHAQDQGDQLSELVRLVGAVTEHLEA